LANGLAVWIWDEWKAHVVSIADRTFKKRFAEFGEA
jgi:hypothetical protein